MNTKGKKLLAIVLTIAVCMGNMVTINADERAENTDAETENVDDFLSMGWDSATEDNCDVKIQYQITGHWDHHYNVDVTLENMTDERIDNWEIRIPANYEIENIWNAKITDHYDNRYKIHNAEWNQDIPVDGSVSFGMTVICEEEIEMPAYTYTAGLMQRVHETDYKVEFKNHSQWENKFSGQIIVTNQREEPIEDWSVFLYSNFEIVQIWNAAIADQAIGEDSSFYDIENPGSGQNIAPGQSVEFGFIAECDGEPELSKLELYMVTSDIDFSDSDDDDFDYDEDDSEFEERFILDSDYFETREEYDEYLKKHGLTDEYLIELEKPQAGGSAKKAARTAKKTAAPVPCAAGDLGIDEMAWATQHYMPLSNGDMYLMSARGKNVRVVKGTVTSNGTMLYDKGVNLKGFGHGQTFEQFILSGRQEYYLLAGGPNKKFSMALAVMPRSFFEKRVSNLDKEEQTSDSDNEARISFDQWGTKSELFRIMTDLEYANKAGKSQGKLYRTDAALTADGATLAIWKEVQDGDRTIHEISLYEMKEIMNIYMKLGETEAEQKKTNKKSGKKGGKPEKEKKNQRFRLSFSGDSKRALQKACIGSFAEEWKKGKESALKPNNSFQSLDIEKYIKDGKMKWRIAITSGNEIADKIPATITRLEVEKSKKAEGGLTYKAFRDKITMKDWPGAKLEPEGGHIMGANEYEFIVLRKTGKIKIDGKPRTLRKQYLAKIDLHDIKTPVK